MRWKGQRRYSAAAAMLLAIVCSIVLLGLTASPAQAQTRDGLDVTTTKIYVPDIATETVQVTATYVMVNRQQDELIGDSVRSFYYTTWIIALPAAATDFVAASSGRDLTVTSEVSEETDDIVFASITLPFNLNYQETVTIQVDYTIPGSEPRSEGTVARVNESFLSFSVWVAGDTNQTDVQIIIPDGFTIDVQGDIEELQRVTRAGQQLLEADDIKNPQDFFGQVFGRNDRGLLTETAQLPGATATVRAWPDDPEWVEFVVEAIENDVPIIEDLTGLDWPAGDIEVIETVTPYLYGYGGWFNASSGQIEIGENLERDLILHELGHAWFNNDLIDGRWITEGLAEEFASRTIEATGDERPDPDAPDLDDPLRVPLAEWASPWTLDEENAFDYEKFHYNAAWWVMRQVTDQVGLGNFSSVLVDLDEEAIAYRGDGPIEPRQSPALWTHFFDLLEIQAGAEGLDELFGEYVLTQVDVDRLAKRRTAVDEYHALVAAVDTWSPPVILRRRMSDWQFEDAQRGIAQALRVVTSRDEVDSQAAELRVIVEHDAEPLFASALTDADLERALGLETQLLNNLDKLQRGREAITALAAERDIPLAFDQKPLADSLLEVSDYQRALGQLGRLQDQALVQAEKANLNLAPWPTATGPDDIGAQTSLAEARLATLEAIEGATAIVTSSRGTTETIGSWWRNPQDEIDAARNAFEADELDDALAAAAEAERQAMTASAIGRTRLLISAAVLSGIIFGTGLLLWLRRRSPHQPVL